MTGSDAADRVLWGGGGRVGDMNRAESSKETGRHKGGRRAISHKAMRPKGLAGPSVKHIRWSPKEG
jgi:hypothetical protein